MQSFDLKLMIEDYEGFSPRGARDTTTKDASYRMFLLVGFQLSAFGFRLSAFSFQLSAFSFRPSAFGVWLFGFSAFRLFGFSAFREADGKSLAVSAPVS